MQPGNDQPQSPNGPQGIRPKVWVVVFCCLLLTALAVMLPMRVSDPLLTDHATEKTTDVMRPPADSVKPFTQLNIPEAREPLVEANAVEMMPSSDNLVQNRLTAAKEQLEALRHDYSDKHPEVKEQIDAVASLERSLAVGDPLPLAEAKGKLARLVVRYGPQHPELLEQRAFVESLEWSVLVGESDEVAQAKAELARLRINHADAHPAVQSTLARIANLEKY